MLLPWKESSLPTFSPFADLLPYVKMVGGMGGSVLSPSLLHLAGSLQEVSSGILRPQFKATGRLEKVRDKRKENLTEVRDAANEPIKKCG